jgi:hypothetical protein
MNGRAEKVLRRVLIAIPIVMLILWLASGRERLTKHERYVTVERTNELFGGTETVTESVPGPRWAFGYYIGLDLVGLTTAACLALGAGSWWLGRWRTHAKEVTS